MNRIFVQDDMIKVRRSPQTILPSNSLKLLVRGIEKKNNAFNLLFTIAMLMGFPVKPFTLKIKSKQINRLLIFWCFFTAICRAILLIISCAYVNSLLPSSAARVTFYGYSVLGYVNFLIFTKKRLKIKKVVKKICNFSVHLGCKTFIGKSALKYHLVATFVAGFGIIVMQVMYFFDQEWNTYIGAVYSPFATENVYHHHFVGLVVFSSVFSFNISAAIFYVLLLLCDNAYYSVSQLFVLYGMKIKRNLISDLCTPFVMYENIALFRRIIMIVRETDDCLNGCVFFIYAAIVSSFFNTASVLLTSHQTFRTLLGDIYVGWTSLCSIIAFVALTYSGARVTEKSNALKNELLEMSDIVVRQSPDVSTILTFNILLENIQTTQIPMTGLGLFSITRGFILTITGMIITYGILIYQIGANNQ